MDGRTSRIPLAATTRTARDETGEAHSLHGKVTELALGVLLLALVVAAWVAFFAVAPVDFAVPRPR